MTTGTKRGAIYVMTAAILVAGSLLVNRSSWQSNAELHTLLEVAATLLAMFVGTMAILRYYSKKAGVFLFIATGFIGTAILDGYHTIVTSSFISTHLPSDLPSLIPYSWVVSRSFLSFCMFLSVLAWNTEVRRGITSREAAIYVAVGLFTLLMLLLFAFIPLPSAYFPELIFQRPGEFVPALFLLLAMIGYLQKGTWRTNSIEHWLLLSLIVGVISQAAYMSSSSALFDAKFDMAHGLKIVSYVLVLIGFMVTMFESLRQFNAAVEQLEQANAGMQTEVDLRREAEGRISGHIATLELTNEELEKTKQQLCTTVDELAQKNQELDEFTYVASHDLQEPLRKLTSFSELLKKDLGGDLNERAEKDLRLIVDAATRMRTLVQDLLALSRAGRSAMKEVSVSLDDCVTTAIEALEIRVQETGAKLNREKLPVVIGDPTMLTQLYQNLIGNALKFGGGKTPVIDVTARKDGDRWLLGVRDNGIGIKQQYCNKIFAAFQRLHGRSEYEGTGIGLAICKKTVERHGGTIWVESEQGKGSNFQFTLRREMEGQPC